MRPKPRLAIALALAGVALLAVAGAAQAQDRVRGNVLGNGSSLIGFANAEDTAIEEVGDRAGEERAGLETIELRGPNTLSDPGTEEGERDALLSLTASGALGISDSLETRYRNGQVEDARMELSYQNGCNSPNGQLTVRTVTNRSWTPFDVAWEDTTRSTNGTLDVSGPVLARVPISPEATQANPDISCTAAEFSLDNETTARVLSGDLGGISFFWSGEQPINLDTLNSESGPQVHVNFTTNGPSVNNVTAGDGFPRIVDTGERVTFLVNATDGHGIAEEGVEVNITQHGSGAPESVVTASASEQFFVATKTFSQDGEGLYDVNATAKDTDGWTDRAPPNATGPHLVVDGTAPEISLETLAAREPGANITRNQDSQIPLAYNVTDLSCKSPAEECGSWKLTWRRHSETRTLANGTVTDDGRIQANATLTQPGPKDTARLVVQDAAGNVNRTVTWNLTVVDTHPPKAHPLDGTDLSPNRTTTVEAGTPVTLAFRIDDDLPLNETRLELDGDEDVTRSLPDPDAKGRVETTLEEIPQGDFDVVIVLDDGRNLERIPFGGLSVRPEGAPTVRIDLTSTRIGPDDVVPVQIRDRNLNPNRTNVVAEVNGLEVRPDVRTRTVSDGQDLDVHLTDLSHGDSVALTVRAQDDQGLRSKAQADLTVDGQAPTLVTPRNESWLAPGSQVRFEADDPGSGFAQLTIEGPGATVTGPAPRSVNVDRLVPSTGRLVGVTVTLADAAGNERTEQILLGVDDEDPTVSTAFTSEGLTVNARDQASGIQRVLAAVGVNGAPLNTTQVFQESPDTYVVATQSLTRGDEVRLAVTVRDAVGRTAQQGTRADPVVLTVPDRPPELELSRDSPAVGPTGEVSWNATDPDEDTLTVDLTVEGPSGSTSRTVSSTGTHVVEPDERGRYEVTVRAQAAGNTTTSSTFFYLGPEGRVTQASGIPSDVDPDERLSFQLSFPSPPEQVFVTATDEANASRSANVQLQGDQATATFDKLPEGSYAIQATVVHESGAVEEVQIASVDAAQPISQQLGDLVVPFLIALAILLVVAIAVVWYRRRQEEAEEEEAEGAGEPAP